LYEKREGTRSEKTKSGNPSRLKVTSFFARKKKKGGEEQVRRREKRHAHARPHAGGEERAVEMFPGRRTVSVRRVWERKSGEKKSR